MEGKKIGQNLQLRMHDENNFPLPIQFCTYIWDIHFQNSNYVVFEEIFIRYILRYTCVHMNKIPKEINIFFKTKR
jgi:hypothetical protein